MTNVATSKKTSVVIFFSSATESISFFINSSCCRFNSFIVGPFNELAYAVAQAIITNPGQSYNPFFIYGGTGLGKTHMIQAIGNTIKSKHPLKKIYYVSLEKFAIDYINSIQNKNPNSFKEKYRNGFSNLPLPLMALFTAVVVFVVFQAVTGDLQAFIYFQF